MKIKTATIDDYVSGQTPLPPTFTTGYKQDLAIARQIIRQRRPSGRQRPAAEIESDAPAEQIGRRPLPA